MALDDVARTPIAKEAGLPPLPDDVVRALSVVLRTLGIGLSAARVAVLDPTPTKGFGGPIACRGGFRRRVRTRSGRSPPAGHQGTRM
jgi:hypothetical protein